VGVAFISLADPLAALRTQRRKTKYHRANKKKQGTFWQGGWTQRKQMEGVIHAKIPIRSTSRSSLSNKRRALAHHKENAPGPET
jgi:hypothetical protein